MLDICAAFFLGCIVTSVIWLFLTFPRNNTRITYTETIVASETHMTQSTPVSANEVLPPVSANEVLPPVSANDVTPLLAIPVALPANPLDDYVVMPSRIDLSQLSVNSYKNNLLLNLYMIAMHQTFLIPRDAYIYMHAWVEHLYTMHPESQHMNRMLSMARSQSGFFDTPEICAKLICFLMEHENKVLTKNDQSQLNRDNLYRLPFSMPSSCAPQQGTRAINAYLKHIMRIRKTQRRIRRADFR